VVIFLRIELIDISKSFGDVRALDHVNLTINSGEILGLLGENGAGKSTLMNILFGLYRMDEGEIRIDGRPVRISSPQDAISKGIFMVHQQFKLIPTYTVLDNLFINYVKGMDSLKPRRVKDEVRIVEELMKSLGFYLPLDEKIGNLPLGVQQRVEIIKAFLRGASIIILDEPTTNLTPLEVEELFKLMRDLKKKGIGFVFITHKLREVMEIADRVAVLRKGRLVGERRIHETNPEELVEMMVGQRIENLYQFELKPSEQRMEPVLELRDVVYAEKGILKLKNISIRVYPGEIYGIAGIAGNGQSELLNIITGYLKPSSGKIVFEGKDITNTPILKRIELGIRVIYEDRVRDGALPSLPIFDNSILGDHVFPPFAKGKILNRDEISARGERIVRTFKVATPSIWKIAGRLSGGNLQKLMVGRALDKQPRLLVAYTPTRGLDVATTRFVLEKIVEVRNNGGAVIYIGEDLDELISISDRIGVMYKGELMGELQRKEFSKEVIGKMMAGYRLAEAMSK
jgi:simple sugar transport system ATP-binding protein